MQEDISRFILSMSWNKILVYKVTVKVMLCHPLSNSSNSRNVCLSFFGVENAIMAIPKGVYISSLSGHVERCLK